jgi:hypothetical protein
MLALADARVSAAEGEGERALKRLTEIATDARRMELHSVAYLADLARIRIELADPERWPNANRDRDALIEAADRDGFGLVRTVLARK